MWLQGGDLWLFPNSQGDLTKASFSTSFRRTCCASTWHLAPVSAIRLMQDLPDHASNVDKL